MDEEISFLRRRASEERTAALQARDKRARQAHRAMAENYEDRVRQVFARIGTARSVEVPLQRNQKRAPFALPTRL